MPISFDLANSTTLVSNGQRNMVRSYVLTLGSLAPEWDCTKGQLYKAAAALGGTPVYVVSYVYEIAMGTGAINLLWCEKFYRMEFGMPSRVGRQKAYIATRLTTLTQREAMARAQDEFNSARVANNAPQPAAPTTAVPGAEYANCPPANYANIPPTQYANIPAAQYANFPPTVSPPSNYGVMIPAPPRTPDPRSQYGVIIPASPRAS